MAETDRLELEIATKINKSGAEKVAALARAIRSLNNAVKQFDKTNFSSVVNQMSDNLKDFLATVKKSQTGLSALATILKKASPKKATKQVKNAAEVGKLGTETTDTGEAAEIGTAPKIKPTGSDILPTGDTKKPKDDEAKKEKSKLLASIKRVAVYRSIRAVLKDIAKYMQDAFSVASQKLPQFNQSFSQIKSSLAVINGSVGVLATALLPIVEPLLKGIATVIGTISNSIAKTIAVIRGQNSYLKVNTKYWKDQKDAIQGSLLAFDTFTTLNLSDDTSGLYETENLDNVNNALNTTTVIMEGILVTAGLIFALNFSGKLKDINGLLGKIGKGLKSIPEKINNISSAGLIMASSFAFITSIINLIDVIKNWKSESLVTKITAITAALAGLAAVVFSILAATGVGSVKVMKAISLGLTGATVLLTGVSAMKFADGGMFEGAGTMYAIAGESGAEVVAKGSQGTGVLNVEQFKTAMVQAFYEYGAARGDLSAASVTLNGEKVGKMTASSSYREMVRQGLL